MEAGYVRESEMEAEHAKALSEVQGQLMGAQEELAKAKEEHEAAKKLLAEGLAYRTKSFKEWLDKELSNGLIQENSFYHVLQ